MKINKNKLKKIIQEEIQNVMSEYYESGEPKVSSAKLILVSTQAYRRAVSQGSKSPAQGNLNTTHAQNAVNAEQRLGKDYKVVMRGSEGQNKQEVIIITAISKDNQTDRVYFIAKGGPADGQYGIIDFGYDKEHVTHDQYSGRSAEKQATTRARVGPAPKYRPDQRGTTGTRIHGGD